MSLKTAVAGSSMQPDDPAYRGQSEYTPFFLKIYDPVILGFFPGWCGAAQRRFWWSDTGGTSALGTWTWARAPATFWNEPVCLRAPPSPSSTLMCTSSTMPPDACSAWTSRHRPDRWRRRRQGGADPDKGAPNGADAVDGHRKGPI